MGIPLVSERTKSVLKIDSVTDSKVVGIQYGLDEREVALLFREVIREEMNDLRSVPRGSLPTISSPEALLDSLYVCASEETEVMGFAVNNSGLLISPSAVGSVQTVRNVNASEQFPAETVESYSLLQVLKTDRNTRGLVPAYVISDELHAMLPFVFDVNGARRELSVVGLLRWVRLHKSKPRRDEEVLTNLLLTTLPSAEDLIGGPVFTSNGEVMGVAVASALRALVVRQWSNLSDCIKMTSGEGAR